MEYIFKKHNIFLQKKSFISIRKNNDLLDWEENQVPTSWLQMQSAQVLHVHATTSSQQWCTVLSNHELK